MYILKILDVLRLKIDRVLRPELGSKRFEFVVVQIPGNCKRLTTRRSMPCHFKLVV